MQKPDMEKIARLLKEESERNGGALPKLDRIAWHSYLMTEVIDHVDYEKVREHFPTFEDDADANDPVLAMSCGKHYFDPDPKIPDGECLEESEFQGLSRQIRQDSKHLGGKLSLPFAVAWYGKLLGLHQCKLITDLEYELLLEMLPVLEDNPVKQVEEFTRRYESANS